MVCRSDHGLRTGGSDGDKERGRGAGEKEVEGADAPVEFEVANSTEASTSHQAKKLRAELKVTRVGSVSVAHAVSGLSGGQGGGCGHGHSILNIESVTGRTCGMSNWSAENRRSTRRHAIGRSNRPSVL